MYVFDTNYLVSAWRLKLIIDRFLKALFKTFNPLYSEPVKVNQKWQFSGLASEIWKI